MGAPRPFDELRDSGMLWLINRALLHPRGFALALVMEGDKAVGWCIAGNGSEAWSFEDDEDCFQRVEATLAAAREAWTDEPSAA